MIFRSRCGTLLGVTASLGLFLNCCGAVAVTLPQMPHVAGAVGGTGATFTYAGPTLTVNQSATRVVIDWQSFSIGAGGTVNFNQPSAASVAFNRVSINPATGLSPLSALAGALNAKGGVWLFSTGGILIGNGATVNVGSFAGITAPPSAVGGTTQLLFTNATGQTTVSLDPPKASGVEQLTVQTGATVNATAGYVVLQGETMTQAGQVSASDGVEYLVSEAGQISFTQTGVAQQLQSAHPIVVVGQDAPSFTHAGNTTGAWIGIDTPAGALQSGYHGVINLGGLIDATAVKPGAGGAGVVLLVGSDAGPMYPGYNGSTVGVDASGGAIVAANGLTLVTQSAKLGPLSVGGSLGVSTYDALNLTQSAAVGGSATLASATGVLAFNGNLSVNGSLLGSGRSITVGPNVPLRSDALGAGRGGLVLSSQGDVLADATSLLVAGMNTSSPTDNVTVKAGSSAASGGITLGQVSAVQAFVQSHSAGKAGRGAITLNGPVQGVRGVTVLVNDTTAVGSPGGDLNILGNVVSSGFVDAENLGSGALTIGGNVSSTGGQVFLYSVGNGTVLSGGTVSGASVFDHTSGALNVAAGGVIRNTGTSPAPVAPIIPAGSDTQRASGLNLSAASLIISGSVVAGSPAAPDDIYIEALTPSGATATIGGPSGSGFTLSNASFGQLTARNVIVMSGPGESQAPGANLAIQNLTLDSTKISALWLGASSSRVIAVNGALTVNNGPVDLRVGFARQGGAAGGLDGFIPGEIDISGALGGPTAPLGTVNLIARNDVFIGSSGFITAARANPSFDAFTQSSLFSTPPTGAVQVAANTLQFAAQGRIIQQNTGLNSLIFAGLDINAPTAAQPLIYVPTTLQGRSIGGAFTPNYAAGPSRVDLFGTLNTASGPNSQPTAARTPYLLDSTLKAASSERINGCVFGADCVLLTAPSALTFQGQTTQAAAASATSSVAATLTSTIVPDVVTFLTPTAITLRQDDDRLGGTNPITESGNGDLSLGGGVVCPTSLDAHAACPPR